MYLNNLPVCLVHLICDHRSVFYKLPDSVYVVVGDEQQIFWPGTKEDLILESHDHQFIKLYKEKYREDEQQLNQRGFEITS